MSDLLAPVLCEIKNESETFWCFVGLMQKAIFVCTPTDNDIDKNLVNFPLNISISKIKKKKNDKSFFPNFRVIYENSYELWCRNFIRIWKNILIQRNCFFAIVGFYCKSSIKKRKFKS